MPNVWSTTYNPQEILGTAQESYDDSRGILKASVQLRVPYAQRHLLVAEMIGGLLPWPKGSVGIAPVAKTAAIVPETSVAASNDDGYIDYEAALVTINFSTEFSEVFSESLEPTAEFITLDHRWFRWGAPDGEVMKEEEAPGYLVRGINFCRTDYKLSSVATPVIALTGFVNEADISSSMLGITFQEETLLYAPPTVTHKYNSSGVSEFEITKKFTWKPEGWNKFFRSKTGTWSSIYLAGGAEYKPYVPDDLSVLL